MRKALLPLLAFSLILCMLTGCAISPAGASGRDSSTRSFDAGLVNMKAVNFTVESTHGSVQIRRHKRAAWHDLEVGEVIDGFALIRTGIRSGAVLTMKNGKHGCQCKIGSLLCEASMGDIYRNVLCPEGLALYNRHRWEVDDVLDRDAMLVVSRDALNGFQVEEGLLAEASSSLNIRNQQEAGAAGAAASGGGAGGAGGGGGCGPGG